MLDFWHWLRGLIRIHLTGADVSGSLSLISRSGIMIFDGETKDELNAFFTIKRTDYQKAVKILAARGDKVEIVKKQGFYWVITRLIKRPVLTMGILLLLFLNLYLPGKILFVEVEGNNIVPTRQIIEEAQKNGLSFGSDRREIRSERIKNALLEAIPQLQWTGVNTIGCVAVISVRERQTVHEQSKPNTVSSIVASRDGVIWECTVTRGNPVCKIGQAVKAGEVLISAYTDCGLKIQATRAEGEVFAKTERVVSAIFPRTWLENSFPKEQTEKYSLIIGKKRINLYKGSGIPYPTCGKIYEEKYLTLPGNFRLPIVLVKETWITYKQANVQLDKENVCQHLSDFSAGYLCEQMIAGRILVSNETASVLGDIFQLDGEYACLEMIGQVRNEEVYGDNE